MNFPEIEKHELIQLNDENVDYKTKESFGFYQMMTIRTLFPEEKPNKKIVRVRHLSCNTFGRGTRFICREDWFLSMRDALNNIQGIKVKPKPPKRKLILQPPATIEELNEYLGMEAFTNNS